MSNDQMDGNYSFTCTITFRQPYLYIFLFHSQEKDGEKKEEKDTKEDEKKKPKHVTVKEPLTSSVKIIDKKDPSEASVTASKAK